MNINFIYWAFILIFLTGLIIITQLSSFKEKSIEERATNFITDCNQKNYSICMYLYLGGYDQSEFINLVEEKGYKFISSSGKYANYLYFQKKEK